MAKGADMDKDMAGTRVLVKRHALATRLTHWVNAVAIFFLIGTGLQIFNAHPYLYWGDTGSVHETPWLSMMGMNGLGRTSVFGVSFDTTGLFGFSEGQVRGFPDWTTLPGERNLALGRNWHFLFAWVLILNGILYYVLSVANRHFQRDMVPTGHDLSPRNIWRDFVNHLFLRYPKGRESLHYHPMQKIAYFSVVAVLIPGIILTGMSMSPGLNAAFPWLVELFGGRQSARSLHFIFMVGIVLFIVVHLAQVVLAGVWNEIRSMVTGKWAIEESRA